VGLSKQCDPNGCTAENLKKMEAVNYAATKAFELKEASTKGNDFKERVDKGAYEKLI
jgi:hypothetical protein